MRLTIFCKSYRAMYDHATCEAGVCYDKFKGLPFDQKPCFWKRGKGKPPNGGCEAATFPTEAEIAQEDAEHEKLMENTMKARAAIVAHLGGPWKHGMKGGSGVIDCPVCGGKETLGFSRAGCNGHIHARCANDKCVGWME